MGLMECQLEDKKAGRNAMEGHFEEKERKKRNKNGVHVGDGTHTHTHTGPFWLMECKLKKDQKLWA